MIVLALDTALNVASACLWDSDAGIVIARESLARARGHEAVLLTLVERVMREHPEGFEALDRIAVTVGPGSFTGLRIGVAAARAFGLVTGAPVVGVSTLAAFAAAELGQPRQGRIVSSVDARKGRVFVQAFDDAGRALTPAAAANARDYLDSLEPGLLRLVGSGAPILAIEAWRHGRAAEVGGDLAAPDIATVARLGALADPKLALPRPLYLESTANPFLAAPRDPAQQLAATAR